MQRTLFDTPLLNTALRGLSWAFLKSTGWTIEGRLPENARKCVMIGAPHTSNWDLPYTLMVAFVLRLRIYWMGKHELFKAPFGGLMRWLGGVAVDRSNSGNVVAASIEAIRGAQGPLQLVVAPQGTRSNVRYWRTGFYHIATGAGVPIVMAYIDYDKKRAGLGPEFVTTGDVEADMARIKAFYAPMKGKNPGASEAGS